MRRLLKWLAVFEIAGNLAIFLAHRGARLLAPPAPAGWAGGTRNAHEAGAGLWRSGRPTAEAYRALAAAGVGLIVDLRAEGGEGPDPRLGLEIVRLPVADGQPPDPAQLAAWRETLDRATGPVLVHCSAGVGRTGSMVAARRVLDEGADPVDALIEALAVGPPSLEQLAFILGLPGRTTPPPAAVAISRVLDAPRRLLSRLRRWAGTAVAGPEATDTLMPDPTRKADP